MRSLRLVGFWKNRSIPAARQSAAVAEAEYPIPATLAADTGGRQMRRVASRPPMTGIRVSFRTRP